MDLEIIFVSVVALTFLLLPFLIWRSVHKENKKREKEADNIKVGDWYKQEYINSNPFEKPLIIYVCITNIKRNYKGTLGVEYTCEKPFKIKQVEADDFIGDFVKVENIEEEYARKSDQLT